jgi:hypothetical protein
LSIQSAKERSAIGHEATVFAPTGGVPVRDIELENLQTVVREIASDFGYPNPPTRSQQAAWDAETAIQVHQRMEIAPAEAAHAGVWSFLGCVLVPDLVRWRFWGTDGSSVERFLGANRGIRNTIGRLWWRAEVLGAGGPDPNGRETARSYLEALGEDQLVQITERPAMSANRAVAGVIVETYLQFKEASDVGGRPCCERQQKGSDGG